MRITYDSSIDAAYIYFADSIECGQVEKTFPCDPQEVNGEINLDFDKNGVLLGVEVQEASKKLPKEVIEKAEKIE